MDFLLNFLVPSALRLNESYVCYHSFLFHDLIGTSCLFSYTVGYDEFSGRGKDRDAFCG